MLQQLSQALEPTQQLQMLQLQEREMELLRNNYNALVTASTLVAGFAYGGCIDFTMPGGDPLPEGEIAVGMRPEVLITFYCLQATSMVLGVYSTVVATATVVYGPDMAINGAKGTSTSIEVACVITRAIGGMRLAKYHIYGSFAGSLLFLLIATCLGTMDKIGYVARMGVPASHHKAGAGVIAVIFGGGILIIIWAYYGVMRIFCTDTLTEARRLNPKARCLVCGDTGRDGMTAHDRRILYGPACCDGSGGDPQAIGFKCYQCIGLSEAPLNPHEARGDPGGTRGAPGGAGDERWWNPVFDEMSQGGRSSPWRGKDAGHDAPYGGGWDMVEQQSVATAPTASGSKSKQHAAADFTVASNFHLGGRSVENRSPRRTSVR